MLAMINLTFIDKAFNLLFKTSIDIVMKCKYQVKLIAFNLRIIKASCLSCVFGPRTTINLILNDHPFRQIKTILDKRGNFELLFKYAKCLKQFKDFR